MGDTRDGPDLRQQVLLLVDTIGADDDVGGDVPRGQ